MKKLFGSILFATTLLFQPAVAAERPDEMVRMVVDELLHELRENKAEIAEQGFDKFVGERLLPHFDFGYMSQLVLSRHWRTATPAQRTAFTEQFRGLLVKTYAGSLNDYTDQEIEFMPYRPGPDPEDANVSTEIVPSAGPAIPIDYALHLVDGKWMVYDISVDGLSLVTNYRRSFGKRVKSDGIDALIEDLKQKNN